MNSRFNKTLTAAAVALVFATGAYAGEDKAATTGTHDAGMKVQSDMEANLPRAGSWYLGKQVEEIEGKDVEMGDDNDIGKVTDVVQDDGGKYYAVVSVGGFLGIGDKEVTIALDELQPQENDLMIPSTMTKASLEAQPKYVEGRYVELDDDYRLGEVSVQDEQAPISGGSQFSDLDADKDGVISAGEAGTNPGLKDRWDATDANRDGTIDRAEFSAFEAKDIN